MKKFILFTLVILAGHSLMAQSEKLVKWNYTVTKTADKTYEVHMTAGIGGDYHLYAQNVGVDGPVPTTFTFHKNPLIILDGKVKEVGKLVKKFESVWNGNVNFYEKSVNFVQVVKLKANVKTDLAGKVEFMVCDEKQCLPPSEVDFKVNVGG
ncbi:MAG TPA: protein-disulfide reductase DsbD domain-containing protein [Chitinophagaceae bacterium]|jgi:thiol:disulfide interchange protein DsbD|nr:protein-disulfide reductase DsbD domain-containing protein [Chitinophagaceae bacterium]